MHEKYNTIKNSIELCITISSGNCNSGSYALVLYVVVIKLQSSVFLTLYSAKLPLATISMENDRRTNDTNSV